MEIYWIQIMTKLFRYLILSLLVISVSAQTLPFTKGVNLSGWFQTNSPSQIHFKKYTKKDFENIKSLGADVIRLPINLHNFTNGSPNYELDPLFLNFIDQAVDWAEELEIHILLDNHSFDPAIETEESIGDILIPVWKNMAEHFKNRSNFVYFEILNEPHGIDDSIWNIIQQSAIDAIREIDTKHTIIVGPSGFNSYNNLQYMYEYDDDNLIYTFHFYEPFLFTHQGASWTRPSLVPLGGVPFPYSSLNMPPVPSDLQSTWVASALQDYKNTGTIKHVREQLDIAIEFKEQRNVPLFCGEFGVYIPNANNNDRVLWYNIVRNYLEANDIGWTSWDYHGGFGIFEEFSNGLFDHDLNGNLLFALGFNIPPQSDFILYPDSTGFTIYSDFIESGIISSGFSEGVLNYYNEDTKAGDYSIFWSNPSQYNSVGFKFAPIKDLSFLNQNDYVVSFWIKGNNPSSRFQIRFLDTKESDIDHAWRMSYDIDNKVLNFNGEWQYMEIPFSSFKETGSWDNEWFNPQGLFNWESIELFEIVNEFGLLNSSQLFIDEIKIIDKNLSEIVDDSKITSYTLQQNYPNPFNPITKINYSINSDQFVLLKVYDVLGNEIKTLEKQNKLAGNYSVEFNASNLPSGIYYYRLIADDFISTKKMTLLK